MPSGKAHDHQAAKTLEVWEEGRAPHPCDEATCGYSVFDRSSILICCVRSDLRPSDLRCLPQASATAARIVVDTSRQQVVRVPHSDEAVGLSSGLWLQLARCGDRPSVGDLLGLGQGRWQYCALND